MRVRILATALGWMTFSTDAQEEPARLTNQHADLKITYDSVSGLLSPIVVRDEDARINYPAERVILVVAENGRLSLPTGTPFGPEGTDLWVLPQSQDPGLLYLGVSAEDLPDLFEGPMELTLKAVDGPGHLFAWQASAVGGLDVKMNSADGIAASDRTTPIVGSHEHLNWGFSTSGVYRITFQASARKRGETGRILSPPTTFVFHVEPLPVLTPFQQWQAEVWPAGAPDSVQGPAADPDGDGLVNLVEYALAINPKDPATTGLPECVIIMEGGVRYGALRYRRRSLASDLAFSVVGTDRLASAAWGMLEASEQILAGDVTDVVTVRDHVPLELAAGRFFQLNVRFR